MAIPAEPSMSDSAPQPVRHALTSSGDRALPGLARDLSELARMLQAETDTSAVVQRIADASLIEIDGATAAGITTVESGKFTTVAQTHDFVCDIDEVQYRVGDGPCLSSLRNEVTVRSDDLDDESRWPNYAEQAKRLGVRSLMSFQLFVNHDNLGALNVYADHAGAFNEDSETAGLLLASHAAVALNGKRIEQNLRSALESRDVIGQAKGILMERFKLGPDQAFQILVAISQHQHRKLRAVADDLAATGDLPNLD